LVQGLVEPPQRRLAVAERERIRQQVRVAELQYAAG
jgi:hypothetical protein